MDLFFAGEEENTHWKSVFENIKSYLDRSKCGRGRGRGGHRGGGQRGGGHRGGHRDYKRRNNGESVCRFILVLHYFIKAAYQLWMQSFVEEKNLLNFKFNPSLFTLFSGLK